MSYRSRPFSLPWVVASVVIFTVLELAIALFLAPALIAGRLASPMWRMRVEMLMHLASFWVGGVVVGILSPRVRLLEPAVGAFVSVALVLLTSVFLPHGFMHFSMDKLLIGGGIAFVLALAGAYTGERLMGNVSADDDTARGHLRKRMWGAQGVLSRGDPSWLLPPSSSARR